jgi:hypothetical protein
MLVARSAHGRALSARLPVALTSPAEVIVAMITSGQRFSLFDGATYSIRVGGAIDPSWSERLGGMRVTVIHAGNSAATELFGDLKDQAELISILEALYGLGMPILSVERHVLA